MWIAATLNTAHPPANLVAEITLITARTAVPAATPAFGTRPAHCSAPHRRNARAVLKGDGGRRNPGRRAVEGEYMKQTSSRELFGYWTARRGTRSAPERGEIEPSAIRRALGDLFI